MMIDEVDVKMLKILQGSDKVWKGTIADLAQDLQLSKETVDKRMRILEEAGIILYYDISLTPWIFGGSWIWAEAFVNLRAVSCKDRVIMELKEKLNYFEQATTNIVVPSESSFDLSATFHARSEEDLDQEVQKISNIEGVVKANSLKIEHANVVKFELDNTDWKLLKSLKQNSRKTLKQLSNEIGIRQEEIEMRLNRLVEGKKLSFFAAIDFSKIENWSHIHVKVGFQKKLSKKDIQELNSKGIIPPHNDWNGIENGILTIEPWNLGELKEKTNKIISTGMRIQSLSFEERYLPSQPWLDKLLNLKEPRVSRILARANEL